VSFFKFLTAQFSHVHYYIAFILLLFILGSLRRFISAFHLLVAWKQQQCCNSPLLHSVEAIA